jgi:hypothetical protein
VEAVRRELGENVRSKEINFVGGHTLPNTRYVPNIYPKCTANGYGPVKCTRSSLYFRFVREHGMRDRTLIQALLIGLTLIYTHPRRQLRPPA